MVSTNSSKATSKGAKPSAKSKAIIQKNQEQAIQASQAQAAESAPTETLTGASAAQTTETETTLIQLPLVGPLNRLEAVEKIVAAADEVGIQMGTDNEGHLVVADERRIDRRHEEQLMASDGQDDERETPPDVPNEQIPQEETKAAGNFTQEQLMQEVAKMKAFQDAVAQLAATMGVPAPENAFQPMATTPSTGHEKKNGIARPGANTKTGTVWAIADEITERKGAAAGIGDLKSHPALRQFNDHTIRTQYARWRQFNGVSGRTPSEGDDQPKQARSTRKQETATNFEPMDDETFAFLAGKRSKGTASPFQLKHLEWEENRRNPGAVDLSQLSQAAQPAQPAQATAIPEQMTDEVYNRMLTLERNNTLPAAWKDILAAAKEARNEK